MNIKTITCTYIENNLVKNGRARKHASANFSSFGASIKSRKQY